MSLHFGSIFKDIQMTTHISSKEFKKPLDADQQATTKIQNSFELEYQN